MYETPRFVDAPSRAHMQMILLTRSLNPKPQRSGTTSIGTGVGRLHGNLSQAGCGRLEPRDLRERLTGKQCFRITHDRLQQPFPAWASLLLFDRTPAESFLLNENEKR